MLTDPRFGGVAKQEIERLLDRLEDCTDDDERITALLAECDASEREGEEYRQAYIERTGYGVMVTSQLDTDHIREILRGDVRPSG